MPSEPTATDTEGQRPRSTWLRSQGLGVLCGQATVLLLAIGSVVLAATRDGASAGIGMDDLRGFFAPPSPVHAWLYLLFPVLGLYALNTLLATWDSVVRKWRSGVRLPRAYAPALVHVAFLVGLLAHLVGGLASAEGGRLVLGPSWQALGDGREARLRDLDVQRLPDGGTRQVHATLEVRAPEGSLEARVVRYNAPLSSGLGSRLLLLGRPVMMAGRAELVRGGDRCRLAVEESCTLGAVGVRLLYLHPPTQPNAPAFVRARVQSAASGPIEELWLLEGQARRLGDGSLLLLARLEPVPAVLLQRRHAPGTPWALLASVLLIAGLALMWRRFLPRSASPPPGAGGGARPSQIRVDLQR